MLEHFGYTQGAVSNTGLRWR